MLSRKRLGVGDVGDRRIRRHQYPVDRRERLALVELVDGEREHGRRWPDAGAARLQIGERDEVDELVLERHHRGSCRQLRERLRVAARALEHGGARSRRGVAGRAQAEQIQVE